MSTPPLDWMQSAEDSVLCWLATCDSAGRPNVSPKQIFQAVDAHRLDIAEIASPQSLRNIRANPAVCVSMIDILTQKGVKLTGQARVISPRDKDFPAASAPLAKIATDRFRLRHVISVSVARAVPILAPSYLIDSGTSEDAMRMQAMKLYGLMP